MVEVVENHGETLCRDKALIEIELKKLNKDYNLKVANIALHAPVESTVRDKGYKNIVVIYLGDKY